MSTSGISSSFEGLSRSLGQVPHVLRTRSPLGLPECCHSMDLVRLACFKHAASVRPEPGSNSPSRSSSTRGCPEISVEPGSGLVAVPCLASNCWTLLSFKMMRKLLLNIDTRRRSDRCGCPHSLLNLPLFRFQGAHCSWHTSPGGDVRAGVTPRRSGCVRFLWGSRSC